MSKKKEYILCLKGGRGRPESEQKKINAAIRVLPEDKEQLIARYGSFSDAFNEMLKREKKRWGRK